MLDILRKFYPLVEEYDNDDEREISNDSEISNISVKLKTQNDVMSIIILYMVLERLKNVKKINYLRQIAVQVGSALFTFAWLMFLVLPHVNINVAIKNKIFRASEFIALLGCYIFFVCGLTLIGYIEREQKKCDEVALHLMQLEQLKALGLQSYTDMQFNKIADTREKRIIKFLSNHGNKFDLFGTSLTTIMQTISCVSLLLMVCGNSFDISKFPESTKFNLQGIVDTIGNIFFFTSTFMFLVANLLQNRAKHYKSPDDKKVTLALTSICLGAALILLGKILVSLEAKNNISYGLGMNGISVGIITRIVGMALFCMAYAFMMHKNRQDISKVEAKINELQVCKSLDKDKLSKS
ncbi:hypothetical protein HL033_02195 [Neoehrlichia mikurensis]|uniref:Transmembrane protein n=1 Tax=Neoehrlichia mikurensis TaxID=89586 RepID=A0A9Q9F5Q6_9RICK|nr:hypothetical protein [Neoehrlichia mikurensis]QXK92335.1 hypothetical protein IAH97_02190 [Neoehrlichia mikurensis]QXK92789.1 hypothetical protein HUN61_02185 [Neoehrlichia mikurensis]QXK94030.1 hypothetical protein HL033_02195 [Neoehrlichia mikurensis]UTO55806.1 hypothetical protein LUA82_01920 [Neoehrlichia mikurensis]UTO56720.1 hypothetical protein LUA81_01900 [Neoehrlichia mikurensis]